MVELVDTLGLGPSGITAVGVRVPPPAPQDAMIGVKFHAYVTIFEGENLNMTPPLKMNGLAGVLCR